MTGSLCQSLPLTAGHSARRGGGFPRYFSLLYEVNAAEKEQLRRRYSRQN